MAAVGCDFNRSLTIEMLSSNLAHEISLGVPHGAASLRSCLIRRICSPRHSADFDRETHRLEVSAKPMVSIRTFGGNRHCRVAILGGCYLPTYYLGNGAP